jgi:hypothetical protein
LTIHDGEIAGATVMSPIEESLLAALDETLRGHGFRRRSAASVLACWVRRSVWTGNRAVVVIECPPDCDPAVFARGEKKRCAAASGFYIPVLFETGLQIVVFGPSVRTDPMAVVDRFSNQICVLQSVHVVDIKGGRVWSGATWGQRVTGPVQAAIVEALQSALNHGTFAPTLLSSRQSSEKWMQLPRWLQTSMRLAMWVALLVFVLRVVLMLFGVR